MIAALTLPPRLLPVPIGGIRSRRAGGNRTGVGRATITSLLLMVACSSAKDLPSGEKTAVDGTLDSTEWVVALLNGRPRVDGSNITLRFGGGSAGGYGGCNWYGARYTAAASSIHFDEVESTARSCGTPVGTVEQEERYYRAFRQVAAYRVTEDRLDLTDSAGAVVLVLSRRERAAMNPKDLTGTRWRLRSVNDTVQRSDSSITLDLTAGGISGSAGCRGYTGTYQALGDDIRVTSISMTATECHKGNAALLREGQFMTDLSEASHYVLSTDSLVIVTAPGRRLVFVTRR